jgi:hypothetical protein
MVALNLMARTGSVLFDSDQIRGHVIIKNRHKALTTSSFTSLNDRMKLDKVLIIL